MAAFRLRTKHILYSIAFIQAFLIAVEIVSSGFGWTITLLPLICTAVFIVVTWALLYVGMYMTGKAFWKIMKPWMLKRYYRELSRTVGKEDLDPSIIDDQGRMYYEFPGDAMNLPVARLMKQKEYMEWLSAGINQNNLHMLLTATQEHLVEALKVTQDKKKFAKAMAKVNALISQIDQRREQIIPLDLFINMLAVMLVREDEDPAKFQETIHQEKCDYFMQHIDDYGFFFRTAAFVKLSKQLSLSKAAWRHHLKSWLASEEELRSVLNIISSPSESSKPDDPTETS